MTRRVKRTPAFDIELNVKDEAFIRPPREQQRNWLLNRALREFAADLEALDAAASRFAPGAARRLPPDLELAQLSDEQIMEDWQIPLMEAMAAIAGASHGDVLEIGFGRGVAASLLQQHGLRSHTIIECNPDVARRFETWRESCPNAEIRLVQGKWQDALGELGLFDSIFFHTYALNEEESIEYLSESVTFAAHFFAAAAEHLVDGGVFTYLTNEIDSLSRAHQRLLFERFRSVRVHVQKLEIPDDVQDAWWADSMAVVEVVK